MIVDARGLRCPIPVIRLAKAASTLSPGDLVTVWSTDPAAEHDVPAWARMRGHTVVGSTVLDEPEELDEGGTARSARADVGLPGNTRSDHGSRDTGAADAPAPVATAITVRLGG
ncbi:sulfurtransferase TusA family protein [Sanguibacter inulinus]|uniref:Sulfurtransferase TusA family protein n=2 Tax=Sanguibacter inulinus TaxID=60922 RepID=A0A853ETE0_9MICO|nr:sulfurtransferase TusA family protein [Sanguibacter inulinus]NYS93024.1 sulfurtransferase TusA family protein [Sanguibacter inulinus]